MTAHAKMQTSNETAAAPFDIGFGEIIPDAEIMATGRVPADIYYSEEQFAIEKEIFRKSWIWAGRVEQIAKAGAWFVKDLEFCNTSVIVVRGKDGAINAFHNVCTHRGMRLLWSEKGQNSLFTCPYHGWSFGSDGACKAISDPASFPDTPKDQMGLKPIHVGVWEGFIFINVDPEPAQTLEEYLGPVASRFAGAPFGEFPFSATVRATLDANWKLGADASCEAYHVFALHSKSCKPWVAPSYNPFVHFLGWEPLGPHRMTSIPINREFTITDERPVQKFAWSHASNNVVRGGGEQPKGDFVDHPDINPLKAADWCNDAYYLFPTTSIYAASNGWFIQQYLPLAIDKTLYTSTWFYRSPTKWSEMFAQYYSNASNRDITTEDLFAVKGQHDGLASGALSHVNFGKGEIINRHIAAVMKAAVETYRRNGFPRGAQAPAFSIAAE